MAMAWRHNENDVCFSWHDTFPLFRSNKATYIYIILYLWELFFNPVVFVKGKLILDFVTWQPYGSKRRPRKSAQGRAQGYYIYMQILFSFSYILYVKIYCAYVYVGLELVGQEDIEQHLNASPPAVSRNMGYLPTHHPRHIAHLCVCLCVYLGGFAVDACSLTSPWGFWFPKQLFGNQILKQILEEGSRHLYLLYFVTLSLGKMSLRSPNSLWSFWFPKRPCLSSASFPERGHSPWAPPKGSETGLKPFWNTFPFTISDSMLFRLQHRCFILLFSVGEMCWFCMFWFHCRTISKGNGRV